MEDGVHVYVRDKCVLCGKCTDSCFSGALEMTGDEVTVDDVMQEVWRTGRSIRIPAAG